MSEFKFRLLHADEIECRIGRINEYGVSLLLYKDARADMAILDEIVGCMNWRKSYTRDNRNCIVEIWDDAKKMWVGKEDTGTESFTEKEKGLASDSFKRTCVNWGIGRELYTAPNIFIKKDLLKAYSNDGSKQKCLDEFSVEAIEYDEKRRIKSVTIGLSRYGKLYNRLTFPAPLVPAASNVQPNAPTQQPARVTTQSQPAPAAKAVQAEPDDSLPFTAVPTPTPSVVTPNGVEPLFRDDEQILVGMCNNGTYGEMKNTSSFKKFLAWVKENPTRKYSDEAKQEQFNRFLKLANQTIS